MCDVARSRLIAWVDREIEDSALDAHVPTCPQCRDNVRRIETLSRDIAEYAEALGQSHRRTRVWVPIAAAAAVAFIAVGLLTTANAPRPVAASEPARPGVLVLVPLNEVLPVGEAPPGAVLAGRLTVDAPGQPPRIEFQ